MKQLKISITLSEYKEKHTIYLGGGEWLKHHSKTFLRKYLSTYKMVLLDNVKILNSYNAQIYALYRTFYFDLSCIEVSKVNQCFTDFNRQFNWMFDNIGGCQNSIVFSKISSCISISLETLYIMKRHGQLHKNYSLKNQCNAYIKIIDNFEEKYENERKSLDLDRNYTKRNLEVIKEEIKRVI
ncbi:hypothetical protein [Tamlana flava]|uniref:hypothetical protein n=1 Tax=Tamlana flava TaxID=3158572 RepID=UPI00351ABD1B